MNRSTVKSNQKRWLTLQHGIVIAVVCVLVLLLFLVIILRHHTTNYRFRDAYVESIDDILAQYPYPETVRFTFGYLDDDDIPELLIAEGTGHAEQIAVYHYNANNDSVEEWGKYSSFGDFYYYERQSITASQYGGTGFWYTVYENLNNGEREPLAISCFYDNTYFWAQPYEGSLDEALRFENADRYIVSESEYIERRDNLQSQLANEIHINYYDDMMPYTDNGFSKSIKEFLL